MIKTLILGAHTPLGQLLMTVFKNDSNYKVIAWNDSDIDLTHEKEVDKKIQVIKPQLIINAIWYNDMDACETDPQAYKTAKQINTQIPEYLARVAKKVKAKLVQYSSDYVFNGEPDIPEPDGCTHTCATCSLHQGFSPLVGFQEDNAIKPINKLGKTYSQGEKAIMENMKNYYILRTAGIFGIDNDFFARLFEKGAKEKEILIIDNETTSFTYLPDLAKKTKEIIDAQKPVGVYHVTNAGHGTWYEAAVELVKKSGLQSEIVPDYSDDVNRVAPRPFYSVLLNTKLNPSRDWREALREYITQLQVTKK